jgi:NAD(P)-dependent dehydrogenase (short-subunit alcohol dehydrogenase family)
VVPSTLQQKSSTVVVVPSAGIGYETALALAKKGYDVTIACKSQQRAAQAMNRIK